MSFDHDRGIMAICGRRYKEADEIFSGLLRDNSTSLSWCGLGSAKSGLLTSRESTIGEAIYCFTKAKEIEPASTQTVEWIMCRSMLQACVDTMALHNTATAAQKDANLKIIGGALSFLLSPAIGGMHDANAYQQILGGAGTVLGAVEVRDGANQREQAINDDAFSHELLEAIKKACTEFCEAQLASPALSWFCGEFTRLFG